MALGKGRRVEFQVLDAPPLLFCPNFVYFSSYPAKKYPISNAAVSSASEP